MAIFICFNTRKKTNMDGNPTQKPSQLFWKGESKRNHLIIRDPFYGLFFSLIKNLRPPLSQVSESTKHDESRIHRKLAPSQRRKTLESKSWWFRPDQPGIAASGFTVVVTEERNSEQKEVAQRGKGEKVPPQKTRVSLLRMEIILMILGQLSLADFSINAYIIQPSNGVRGRTWYFLSCKTRGFTSWSGIPIHLRKNSGPPQGQPPQEIRP